MEQRSLCPLTIYAGRVGFVRVGVPKADHGLTESSTGDRTMTDIAGHISRQMLEGYSPLDLYACSLANEGRKRQVIAGISKLVGECAPERRYTLKRTGTVS